jgi:hypothetical protein
MNAIVKHPDLNLINLPCRNFSDCNCLKKVKYNNNITLCKYLHAQFYELY